MNRMWEIREGYDSGKHYGMRSAEDKAYECGYKEGYEAAVEEFGRSEYGHRMRRY